MTSLLHNGNRRALVKITLVTAPLRKEALRIMYCALYDVGAVLKIWYRYFDVCGSAGESAISCTSYKSLSSRYNRYSTHDDRGCTPLQASFPCVGAQSPAFYHHVVVERGTFANPLRNTVSWNVYIEQAAHLYIGEKICFFRSVRYRESTYLGGKYSGITVLE